MVLCSLEYKKVDAREFEVWINPKEVDGVYAQYYLHDVECVIHDVERMMCEDIVSYTYYYWCQPQYDLYNT